MKISVILAHPDESSFNHSIARAAVERLLSNGHEVSFHDLYREDFEPLLFKEEIPEGADVPEPVTTHCREIAEAGGIVVVHPNWWGQPPAILKGWVDRVLRAGVAYQFLEGDSGEGIPKGLLQAKTAIVFNTSNTKPEREEKDFGDPLETIWRNCIFGLCGVSGFYRRTFGVIVTSTTDQRRQWLDEVRGTIDRFFPGSAHNGRQKSVDGGREKTLSISRGKGPQGNEASRVTPNPAAPRFAPRRLHIRRLPGAQELSAGLRAHSC